MKSNRLDHWNYWFIDLLNSWSILKSMKAPSPATTKKISKQISKSPYQHLMYSYLLNKVISSSIFPLKRRLVRNLLTNISVRYSQYPSGYVKLTEWKEWIVIKGSECQNEYWGRLFIMTIYTCECVCRKSMQRMGEVSSWRCDSSLNHLVVSWPSSSTLPGSSDWCRSSGLRSGHFDKKNRARISMRQKLADDNWQSKGSLLHQLRGLATSKQQSTMKFDWNETQLSLVFSFFLFILPNCWFC